MIREIDYKKYEEQLSLLYPTLLREEKESILETLFNFWEKVIEDIEQ